jgi:hypothetical protein
MEQLDVTRDLTNVGAKNIRTPTPSSLNGIATNTLHSNGSGCTYSKGMRIVIGAVDSKDLQTLG